MEVKTNAIVLRTVRYGERSIIVDMLTSAAGRVSFAVRIPKTKRGKLQKQFFQPMSVIAVDYDSRPRLSLQHLRDVRVALPLPSVKTVPAKMCLSMFLAEFLSYVSRDEQQGEPMFGFVVSALRWLDAASQGYANFHIVFMMRLSRFVGFMPNLDGWRKGSVFDMREGRFVSVVPLHSDYLSPSDSEYVMQLARMGWRNMHLFRMGRAQRNHIAELIIRFYRLHVPGMPELKSFGVLKEVFD